MGIEITTTTSSGKYVTRVNARKIEDIDWIPCNSCKNMTKHKKLWNNEQNFYLDEELFDGVWAALHEVYECLGCGDITYKKTWIDSGNEKKIDNENHEFILDDFFYFPERQRFHLNQKFYSHMGVPEIVAKAYAETIKAYNLDLRVLCSIGIRTIIEAICLAEKITESGLKNKINILITKGIITTQLSEGFHLSRLLGNESAHEIKIFSRKELLTAISLIESVLDNYYCSKGKIDILKQARKQDDSTEEDLEE